MRADNPHMLFVAGTDPATHGRRGTFGAFATVLAAGLAAMASPLSDPSVTPGASILYAPDWAAGGGQADGELGYSGAGIGCVDGDGVDDSLAGAFLYDNG